MSSRTKSRGGATLYFILAIPASLVLAGVIWYAYAAQRQAYWDNQVRELCKKEGEGVALRKVILLPGQERPATPNELLARPNAEYVSRWTEQVIRAEGPRVTRTEVVLVRVSDQAILGRQSKFARIGGDPGIADNPSTFDCHNMGIKSIEALVFETAGSTK